MLKLGIMVNELFPIKEPIKNDSREMLIIKNTFGEKSIIKIEKGGWQINSQLENGDLNGGQVFSAFVEERGVVPINPNISENITGLKVRNLNVDGTDIADGYNVFVGSQIEKSGEENLIWQNFADKTTRTIGLSKFKSGEDISILNHEKGHIEDESFDPNKFIETSNKSIEIARKYLNDSNELDGKALASDPEMMSLVESLVQTENKADKFAIEQSKASDKETITNYLREMNYQANIACYGQDFVDTIGLQRIEELIKVN